MSAQSAHDEDAVGCVFASSTHFSRIATVLLFAVIALSKRSEENIIDLAVLL